MVKGIGNWIRDEGSEAGHVLRVWREQGGTRWVTVTKDVEGTFYFDVHTPKYGVGDNITKSETFKSREKAISKAKDWIRNNINEGAIPNGGRFENLRDAI